MQVPPAPVPGPPSPAQQCLWYARLKVQYTDRGLVPGDVYYIINAKWLSKWQTAVRYSSEVEAWIAETLARGESIDLSVPPQSGGDAVTEVTMDAIDNNNLVKAGGLADVAGSVEWEGDAAAGPSGPSLRTGLIPGHDYHIIGEEIWKMLQCWYGGGPSIRRIVVSLPDSGDTRVALYPEVKEDSVVDSPVANSGAGDGSDADADSDTDAAPAAAAEATKRLDAAGVSYVGKLPLRIGCRPDTCWVCGNPGTKHCGKCRKAKYCTVVCQRTHWQWHKVECGSKDGAVQPRFGLVGLAVGASAVVDVRACCHCCCRLCCGCWCQVCCGCCL